MLLDARTNVRKVNLDGSKSKFLEWGLESEYGLYFPTLLNTLKI